MKSKLIFGSISLFVGISLFILSLLGKNFAFADSQVLDMNFFAFSLCAVMGIILIGLGIILFTFVIIFRAKK